MGRGGSGSGGHRGGGSRSSSGGGRSSSSFSSGRSMHIHNSSLHRTQGTVTPCDCSSNKNLFCNPSARCALNWQFMIMPFLLFGALAVYLDSSIIMDVNESKVLRIAGSPKYISEYQIQDLSGSIDIFYLQQPQLESKPSGMPLMNTESIVVATNTYLNYAYFLNEGSTIDISFTAKENWQKQGRLDNEIAPTSVDFYIFKGDSNFNNFISEWKSGKSNYNYFLYRHSNNKVEVVLHINVLDSDVYYLAFVNEFAANVVVDLKYTIGKTQWLLDGITPVCGPNSNKATALSNSDSGAKGSANICSIELQWDDSWQVLLRSPFTPDYSLVRRESKGGSAGTGEGKESSPSSDNMNKAEQEKQPEMTYQLNVTASIRLKGYAYLFLQTLVTIFTIAFLWSAFTGTASKFWNMRNNDAYETYEAMDADVSTRAGEFEMNVIVGANVDTMQVAEVISSYTESLDDEIIHPSAVGVATPVDYIAMPGNTLPAPSAPPLNKTG